jgi:hypothetical protein
VRPQSGPAPDLPPEPPKLKPAPVDFVCEADVRQAMKESRKIYVTPKAIITPAARDLAAPGGILIVS